MTPDRHRIVVVGGGYAGALASVRAARRSGRRASVALVNAQETFSQRLRLHQVATGQDVAEPPLVKLCGPRVELVHGCAESIELDKGLVRVRREGTAPAAIPYDSLIIATGSTVDRMAVPGAAEHAHALSDISTARRLAADLERAPEGARVAVIGAGFTGIEAAAEIAAARADLKVSVISREPLGSRFSAAGREHLHEVFDRLGVERLDGIRVEAIGSGALEPAAGPSIPFDLTVWCGGFAARSLAAASGLASGPRGGALVDRRLRSISHPEVLVVGDAAEYPPLANGAEVRMSCQAGIPAGAHAADVVAASIRGREEKSFDFGFMTWNISLGRTEGLVQWVDRADRPKERVTRGRRAAWIKELITAYAAQAPRWERRVPGSVRWPSAGVKLGGNDVHPGVV